MLYVLYCGSLPQVYESEAEELHRHIIWQTNKKYIDEHNTQNLGYTLAMNEFGDIVSVVYAAAVGQHSCVCCVCWVATPHGQRLLATPQ